MLVRQDSPQISLNVFSLSAKVRKNALVVYGTADLIGKSAARRWAADVPNLDLWRKRCACRHRAELP
jgi:hypothetical protein